MLMRHSLLYLLARGLPGLLQVAAVAWLTRLLSQSEYGQYAGVIAGAALLNALLFQWLGLGVIRFWPGVEAARREGFLATLCAGYLGLVALTGLAGGLVIGRLADPMLQALVGCGVLLLWGQAWFELQLELLRSELRPGRYGLQMMAKALLSVGIGGTLAYLGTGIWGVLGGVFIGLTAPVLWQSAKIFRHLRWRQFDRALLRQLLRYGLPLTAAFSMELVVSSSNRLLLGAGQAGMYAVGYDLAKQTVGLLTYTVGLAASPLLVRAFEQSGLQAAGREMEKVLLLLLGIGLPATVGLSLLAPNLAETLLGPAFHGAAALMPWAALAALLFSVKEYSLNRAFQLQQKTLRLILPTVLAALLNLPLTWWLAGSVGALGAVYATCIVYGAALAVTWLLARPIFPLRVPWKDAAKVALATLAMAGALYPLLPMRGAPALLLQAVTGGAVYAGMLWATGLVKIQYWRRRQET
ncbi:O-antigen/teichoic acid export membrane protein [Tumebacillus sp. BK434]|uniref:lipopolysaccharide biosynthesis protein n=1 Tax=Tumebacillus sp. BK434 TaxID=2512169 RepID=UPI0010491DAB|nr:lipopolysaccharide biosynthesis protein [Tumebacillus sp. BK434]TCP58974.1 O-antigen/teichoic acid export membrane protein [Tumebacillus sp. BK434]